MLVTVRRSKTNQEGEVKDVRFVKDGVARALRTLRAATTPEPGDRVVPDPPTEHSLRLRRTTARVRVAGQANASCGKAIQEMKTDPPTVHRRPKKPCKV